MNARDPTRTPLRLPPRMHLHRTQRRYAAYEAAKRALPADLTPREYEDRVRELAKRYGI